MDAWVARKVTTINCGESFNVENIGFIKYKYIQYFFHIESGDFCSFVLVVFPLGSMLVHGILENTLRIYFFKILTRIWMVNTQWNVQMMYYKDAHLKLI